MSTTGGRRPTPPTSSGAQPWDDITELCRSKLDPEDYEEVVKLGSLEGLIQYGSDLQNQHRSYEMTRLRGFLNQMRSFSSVFDVLVHVKPMTVAPVWGCMRFCLELINEADEVFQMIVGMLDEIRTNLPQIEVYMENIEENDSLKQLCCEEFLLIAEFACQVIVYYRSNPFKNLLGVTWKPFRDNFAQLIRRIRDTTRRIELEAQTLSMKQNARKHEELKKLLEARSGEALVRLPCFRVPYGRNPNFQGREHILDDIKEHFQSTKNEMRVYALHGPGGVGKTQTALEFAYLNQQDYDAVFWVSADSIVKLGQDIADALLKLGRIREDHKFSDQQCRALFLNWLQETDKTWLLIFDNADDLNDLRGCWPVANHGSVLITSRDPASARLPSPGPTTKGHALMSLPSEPGRRLLLKLLDGGTHVEPHEGKLADDIVRELGGFPLAINQMANYIIEAGCGLQDFLDMFLDFRDRNQLLIDEPDTPNFMYPHSLRTVCVLSMERVKNTNKDSALLLEIMAFYDPDGIPESLLYSRSPDDTQFPQLKFLSSKLKFFGATKPLLNQSLASKNQTSQEFTMHRLVAAVIFSSLSDEDKQERFDQALELVYRVYPQLSSIRASLSDVWGTCRLYLPHILYLERIYRESDGLIQPRAKFATVLANAAWFLFEQSLPSQSLNILPTAKSVGEATLDGNEHTVSTVYRTYGAIYLDANNNQEAFNAFSRQLEILSSKYGPDDLATSHGYNNVALAYVALGEYDKAQENYQRAIDIRRRDPSPAKGYQAMTLTNLGVLEGLEKHYDKSFGMLKEGIQIYDETFGFGNYLTASAYFYIGNFHVVQGDLKEGFQAHSMSLTLRRDAIGDTYRTAAAFHKVAWHLHHSGDDIGAEKMLLNSLRIYQNAYDNQGGLGRSSYLMSQVLASLGREEDALNTKALAAKVRKEILGIDPDVDDNLESYDQLVGFLDR